MPRRPAPLAERPVDRFSAKPVEAGPAGAGRSCRSSQEEELHTGPHRSPTVRACPPVAERRLFLGLLYRDGIFLVRCGSFPCLTGVAEKEERHFRKESRGKDKGECTHAPL